MNLTMFSGHSYLLIIALIVFGAGLLIVSIIFNTHVANSVRNDARHREKLLEYYRNIFSQLGVILIGIGVSLFIFFFQQNYQDHRRRESELQSALAKMSVRISRGAAAAEGLKQYDELLDDGGPYVDPENGGSNKAVTASGAELSEQVKQIFLVERDVDPRAFDVLFVSSDLESSFIAHELDSALWFNMVKDESDLNYAILQLASDYDDLHTAVGTNDLSVPLDPASEQAIKKQVLDVFYDLDLLRQRSRRILGRTCWLLSKEQAFISAKPVAEIEADAQTQSAWLDQTEPILAKISLGGSNCAQILSGERN